MILIPKRSLLTHNRGIIMPSKAGMEGLFRFRIGKGPKDGPIEDVRIDTDWFGNLILDQGLNRYGNGTDWFRYCQVGSGNTPPTNADTGLVTLVAAAQNVLGSGNSYRGIVNSPDYYGFYRMLYRFSAGAAAGNLQEVGIGWGTTGSTLHSRALIVDGGGNPISLTILADEILEVFYEWRIYPPTTDKTGVIDISGTDYDYIVRAMEVDQLMSQYGAGWAPWGADTGGIAWGPNSSMRGNNQGIQAYQGNIGAITGGPTGAASGGTVSISNAAYVNDSLSRNATQTYGIGTTNPIRSIAYNWNLGSSYQVQFDPAIPKSNMNQFTIGFTHSWARRSI